jgi:hypothetical protein
MQFGTMSGCGGTGVGIPFRPREGVSWRVIVAVRVTSCSTVLVEMTCTVLVESTSNVEVTRSVDKEMERAVVVLVAVVVFVVWI